MEPNNNISSTPPSSTAAQVLPEHSHQRSPSADLHAPWQIGWPPHITVPHPPPTPVPPLWCASIGPHSNYYNCCYSCHYHQYWHAASYYHYQHSWYAAYQQQQQQYFASFQQKGATQLDEGESQQSTMHVAEGEEEGEEEIEIEKEEVGTEDSAPCLMLSEEAIALFARSEARRRQERKQKQKERQQQRLLEKGKSNERREKRYREQLITQRTLDDIINNKAENGKTDEQRAAREQLFGVNGAKRISEIDGMLNTIYNRACDLKQPVIWPHMPLRM